MPRVFATRRWQARPSICILNLCFLRYLLFQILLSIRRESTPRQSVAATATARVSMLLPNIDTILVDNFVVLD
jgi:hypothetical protein